MRWLLWYGMVMALFIPVTSAAQEYSTPESVVYDTAGARYFVSNFGGDNIVYVDAAGEMSCFKEGIARPLGMVIIGDILYVVENPNTVGGYSIADGSARMSVTIDNAVFINDITADTAGMLYVTDSNANSIYKIDTATGQYDTFYETPHDGPNGILFDGAHNRLIVCYFHDPSRIQAIDLADSSISTLAADGLINLDGIALDSEGNIYVSSWGPGSFESGFGQNGIIYKFDGAFEESPEVTILDRPGPADIFWNNTTHRLFVPFFFDNIVDEVVIK